MHLALVDLFRAKWTDEIHAEWIRNVLGNRPDLHREALERTRDLMNTNAPDCLVRGYEPLIPSLHLPDPNDRHVLAAAIVSHANVIVSHTNVIVTYNRRDFPLQTLAPYGIMAQHPDDFIRHLLDLSSESVFLAVQRQRLSLKNPPKTIEELLNILEQQGLAETVAFLRRFSPIL